MKIHSLLALFILLFIGCSAVSTETRHTPELGKVRHVYVEHRLNDNHALDELIVQELKHLGYDAAAGPLTMMPENAEAILSYEDEWEFDFTTHMVALTVNARTVGKEQSLGSGRYFNRGVSRIPPEKIVHTVITSMFKPI